MVAEVLEALQPRNAGRYVDGTLGGGSHAAAILAASAPSGWLLGSDRDGAAIEAAQARLAEFEGRFELRRGNYSEMAGWVPAGSCDGVLLDLGVSSHQLDTAERGFSFQHDAPLDMRFDMRQPVTAADFVNSMPVDELADLFWKLGDERDSRRIARAIDRERQMARINTTSQLAGLIERINPRGGLRTHPATRVFQALRMAVNDELGSVRAGLQAAMTVLKPGGRLAVITFHSGEDRVVKVFGRDGERDYEFDGEVDVPELRRNRTPLLRRVSRKAIQPGDSEVAENPRSRSAQLRVFERL